MLFEVTGMDSMDALYVRGSGGWREKCSFAYLHHTLDLQVVTNLIAKCFL